MQLKVIIPQQVFRFDQNGQEIPRCTDPFACVEVHSRGDVVELYDQSSEHLALAFRYGENDRIISLSDEVAVAIQNFLCIPGAWYLENPLPPDQDVDVAPVAAEQTVSAPALPTSSASEPISQAGPETGSAIFQPNPEQRALLRDIQVTAEVRRQLIPDPNAAWDRQVQKLLLAQQMFGIDDPAKAHVEAETKLNALIAQAKTAGIPEEVVRTNTEVVAQLSIEDLEDDDEDGEQMITA